MDFQGFTLQTIVGVGWSTACPPWIYGHSTLLSFLAHRPSSFRFLLFSHCQAKTLVSMREMKTQWRWASWQYGLHFQNYMHLKQMPYLSLVQCYDFGTH